jgi:hypothetical protein
LALLLVLACGVPAMAKDVHTGKIVFAGDGKLVIADVDDTNESFVVLETTKITRDGKAASLSELAAGDAATVTAKKKDGKLIATEIIATTGK